MNRGNRKALIFEDDRDRRAFTKILTAASHEYNVEILGGSQMGTHFHLIVVTPHANVSEFMQALEGKYAEYSNCRHERVGHLFQGRFTGVLIDNDLHLFTTVSYVFDNPLKSGFVERREDWPWSTYAATIGLRPVPSYLSLSWVKTLFPAESFAASQQLLRDCLNASNPVMAYLLAVDPTTDVAIYSYVSERLKKMRGPCSYRELSRPPLDVLFPRTQTKDDRDRTIEIAHVVHGYTLAGIATAVDLHAASVSRIFRTLRSRTQNDHQ
jgi:putative transposase